MSGRGDQHLRSGRASELAGGLAALLAILLLAVGVPLGLAYVVGWPLPHALPSLAELSRAFTGGAIPDEFIVKALAVIGWAYWAQFMVCLWAELAAARKGRPTRHLPLAGLNQAIATRLIGAVLLLSPAPGWPRHQRPQPSRTLPPDRGRSGRQMNPTGSSLSTRFRRSSQGGRVTRCGESRSGSLATPGAGRRSSS